MIHSTALCPVCWESVVVTYAAFLPTAAATSLRVIGIKQCRSMKRKLEVTTLFVDGSVLEVAVQISFKTRCNKLRCTASLVDG
jgi:hypothetical protein